MIEKSDVPVKTGEITRAEPSASGLEVNTRRGFLSLAAGLAAGMALDPERRLWVPGRKLISIPAVQLPPWRIWRVEREYTLTLDSFMPDLKQMLMAWSGKGMTSGSTRITFDVNRDGTALMVTESRRLR